MSAVGDLIALRDGVVAALAQALPKLDVATHGGTFDEGEIKRFALKAPAVRVAITGVERGARFSDGRWRLPVNFAAVIITRDDASAGNRVTRDTAALLYATAIELTIAGSRFGFSGVFQPENVAARSEYSGPVDKIGVALWQVTWTSPVLIGAPVGEQDFDSDAGVGALVKAIVNGVTTYEAPALTLADPLEDAP